VSELDAQDAKLVTLQGAGHGFKDKDAETAEREMLAWFDSHLRPAPAR
jgi:dipeptidyl aminopeptidase/acylaminoacyl peptidase